MIDAIACATDFSEASHTAFAHALRLAVAARCRLDLLHVRSGKAADAWGSFPHVRDSLASWRLLPEGVPPEAIFAMLGVSVRKVEIHHHDAVSGIARFLISHRPDLLVVATHGQGGVADWLKGSVSEALARETHLPALFVAERMRPFVDAATGALSLGPILVPVAETPPPRRALLRLAALLEGLRGETQCACHFLHVGKQQPGSLDGLLPDAFASSGARVSVVEGDLIETLLDTARSLEASLIAMPTTGHDGFLDALRGSTTERILHRADCPLLALPA
ncbi:MAG: universal stress protein [Hyphomicrobiaceae bacterium]